MAEAKALEELINASEVEDSLLSAVLIHGMDAYIRASTKVDESMFTGTYRQVIWSAYTDLFNEGSQIDDVTTLSMLERKHNGSIPAGLIQLLGDMIVNVFGALRNVEEYARIVSDRAQRRRIARAGREIIKSAVEEQAEDAASKSMSVLTDSLAGREGDRLRSFSDLAKDWALRFEAEYNGEGEPERGLITGYDNLDSKLLPMTPGELIFIGARPSMGKTTLALNIAEREISNGGRVYMRSAEMPANEIVQKMLASTGRIDYEGLQNPQKFRGDDWPKLSHAMAIMKDGRFCVSDAGMPSVGDVRAEAFRARAQMGGLGLIIVDYLQLMREPTIKRGRTEELSYITGALKSMAKELECPVIVLSQLNREVEKREPPRPRLADLRESGSIEQDGDTIMLMYRESEYFPDSAWGNVTEVIIAKQRKGRRNQTGYIALLGNQSRFVEPDMIYVKKLIDGDVTAAKERAAETEAPHYDWYND